MFLLVRKVRAIRFISNIVLSIIYFGNLEKVYLVIRNRSVSFVQNIRLHCHIILSTPVFVKTVWSIVAMEVINILVNCVKELECQLLGVQMIVNGTTFGKNAERKEKIHMYSLISDSLLTIKNIWKNIK